MIATDKRTITVENKIKAPVEKVWSLWTEPKHIVNWNQASDDWYTPRADNDLRVGGKFSSRMEARDGSAGFDFGGEYDSIVLLKHIKYTMEDGRKVNITFLPDGNETYVSESFEPEQSNPVDFQKEGWQSILDNFKKYVENSDRFERMHFDIEINAGVEKVYNTMIDLEGYRNWTTEFNPSSHFQGSWAKGAKIYFIGENQQGDPEGMVSVIRENITNKFISIEHVGFYKNGNEILCGPDVEEWAGARENYSFKDFNGKTILSVDVDVVDKYSSYFIETWPKALEKLKSICEK